MSRRDKKLLVATTTIGASAGAAAIAANPAPEKVGVKSYNDYLDENYKYFSSASDVFEAVAQAFLVETLSTENYANFKANFLKLFGSSYLIHAPIVHYNLSVSYPKPPHLGARSENIQKDVLLSQLIIRVWRIQVLKMYYAFFENKTVQNTKHLTQPPVEYLLATMSRILNKRIILLQETPQEQSMLIFGNEHKETIFIVQDKQYGFLTTRLSSAYFIVANRVKKKIVVLWQDPLSKQKDQKQKQPQGEGIVLGALDLQVKIFKFFDPRKLTEVNSVNKLWRDRADKTWFDVTHKARFRHLTSLAWKNFQILVGKNEKIAMTVAVFSEHCQKSIKDSAENALWKERIQILIKYLREKDVLREDKDAREAVARAQVAAGVVANVPDVKAVNSTEQRLDSLLEKLKCDHEFYRKACARSNLDKKNNLLSQVEYKKLLDYIKCHPEFYPPIVATLDETQDKVGDVHQLIHFLLISEFEKFTAYLKDHLHLMNAHDQFYLTPLFWVQLLAHLQPENPRISQIARRLIEWGARILPNIPIIAGDYLGMCVQSISEKGHGVATILSEIIVDDLNSAKELTDNSDRSKPLIVIALIENGIRRNLPFGKTIRKLLQKGLTIRDLKNPSRTYEQVPFLFIFLQVGNDYLCDIDQDNSNAVEIFSILLEHHLDKKYFTDPKYYEESKELLHAVIFRTCRAVVEVFFKKYPAFCKRVMNDQNGCLLHSAVSRKRVDFATMDFLIEQGCSPLQKNGRDTILHKIVREVEFENYSLEFQVVLEKTRYFIMRHRAILSAQDKQGFTALYYVILHGKYAFLPLFDSVLYKAIDLLVECIKPDCFKPEFLATLNYFLITIGEIADQAVLATYLSKIFLNIIASFQDGKNVTSVSKQIIWFVLDMLLDYPQLKIDAAALSLALKNILYDEYKRRFILLLIIKKKINLKDSPYVIEDALKNEWHEVLVHAVSDEKSDINGNSLFDRVLSVVDGDFSNLQNEFLQQLIKKCPHALKQKIQCNHLIGYALLIVIARYGADDLFALAMAQNIELTRDHGVLDVGISESRMLNLLRRSDICPVNEFGGAFRILNILRAYNRSAYNRSIGESIFEMFILHPNNDRKLVCDEFKKDGNKDKFESMGIPFDNYFLALQDIYQSENAVLKDQLHKNHFMVARKESPGLLDLYFQQIFGWPSLASFPSLSGLPPPPPPIECYLFTVEQKGMLLQCPAILVPEDPMNVFRLAEEYESGLFVRKDVIFVESCYVKVRVDFLKKFGAGDESSEPFVLINYNLKRLRRIYPAMDVIENPDELINSINTITKGSGVGVFVHPFASQLNEVVKELRQPSEKGIEILLLFYWKLKTTAAGAEDPALLLVGKAISFIKRQVMSAANAEADVHQAAGAGEGVDSKAVMVVAAR